ncbi:methyltransferase domain-containing protein [Colletotrichum graminicola M1.001]|uniref:Methyltransferase domain-containing protein n=1 Tax=Colletotrichum graminicola (strain M1.001 / M2 / FGSC 10212) TaxID=645133 RepID=E3QVK5_COLGM|nr:methyltransferase domain-containing protein [Colletotrichum graminicola M1.001]EFQ34893.1 methyltransferase domain-containing protein [Colletotrichum graminicola M1.001]
MAEQQAVTKSPTGCPSQSPEAVNQANIPPVAENTVEPAADTTSGQVEATVDALENSEEGDGYETVSDGSSNETASLASSIRDFNFENKRRYHKFKEGRYAFPNDDAEQEREDMKHAMVATLCGGKLHSAPLKNPQKILDIGTGTGIWATDTEIKGIDLSPIQPLYVPAHVSFIVDDAEAEWLQPENSVDYVHVRNMSAAVEDWSRLMSQAYRVLKPGGWIELQEMKWSFNCDDGTMPSTYAVTKMIKLIWEGLGKFGIEADVADTNPQRLKDAGFINQVHDVRKVPVGEWPKREDLKKIGAYFKAVIYDGLYGITVGPLTRGLGWTAEEVEVFLIDVRKDLLQTSIHSYVFYHSVAGQKPEETEVTV